MADVAKLRRVLARVEEEAAKDGHGGWNQGVWAVSQGSEPGKAECGTAFCFAGWVAALDGMLPTWQRVGPDAEWQWVATQVSTPEGVEYISDYARRSLELDWDSAWVLFGGSNTLDDLRRHVEHIAQFGTTQSKVTLADSDDY
jgi:hypothetical protein